MLKNIVSNEINQEIKQNHLKQKMEKDKDDNENIKQLKVKFENNSIEQNKKFDEYEVTIKEYKDKLHL